METDRMNILIAGGTGLIGTALRTSLEDDGHRCWILSRTRRPDHVYWNPADQVIDTDALPAFDAVVNLSGRDIGCRWTNSVKKEIRQSRVRATAFLSDAIARAHPSPRAYINASAIGYYGTQPAGEVSESTPAGEGFLAEVCRDWEAATRPAADAGIRTVLLRCGVVITPAGGALKKMLPVFKSGLGGPLADGKQWMSWIALDDLTGLIRFCLENPSVQGPLNAVAPQAVTNADFTTALANALNRPAAMRVPAAALRLGFGQMADETLLSSVRASAAKALQAGYTFQYLDIKSALSHLLPR